MVTIYRRRQGLSRRELLKRGTVIGAGALLVVVGQRRDQPGKRRGAWKPTALKPETMATLIQWRATSIRTITSPTASMPWREGPRREGRQGPGAQGR